MGILKDWWERHIVADDPYDDQRSLEYVRSIEREMTDRKPRLARVTRAPGREEWTQWRENPVTEFVMAALKRNADEHSDQWHDISWNGGEADQRTLDQLRQRADTLRGIAEADYEAFCETLGLEPEAPRDAA